MAGWIKNEVIAVANNRSMTIVDCNEPMNKTIRVQILETKDSIYLAKKA